ncbi:hypothetical protein RRG08_044734 [Elysia crispata]|uniref:Uncharacterized protein n=1 Tax=Elysia crispata TaxID=231223 RepID=A0AAE0ZHJ9_9GAST|nr:hypothetical protein RRG08_044734 [Elysia crispata]
MKFKEISTPPSFTPLEGSWLRTSGHKDQHRSSHMLLLHVCVWVALSSQLSTPNMPLWPVGQSGQEIS